jgi:predicted adenine nucleotide alpha hydrolase (AANH) superfamily ATPase
MDFSPPYDPKAFLAAAAQAPDPPERCRLCYRLRLEAAAQAAAARGTEVFSTTLLYSRRQKHDLLVEEGQRAAEKFGPAFLAEDWRRGWKEGREISAGLGLHRQTCCGCVFEESR